MYEGKTVGVVIPAYNEESFIGEVIDTLPEFVDRAYVIDDASTDGTLAEIEEHAAEANESVPEDPPMTDGGVELDPRVVPIQHEENRGVGGAIKTGYLHALDDGVDVTAVMGGDGQTEPDIVERIITPVVEGKADYAKGNRLLDRDRDDMPAFRQVGNFMLTFITKIASGYWKLMDPQNGSTAISHEALERVGIEDMYEGYGYCNDLLIRLNTRNMTVADVSRRAVYKDEESHIDYRTYIPKVSTMLLRGFLRRLRTKYLVNDFHPLPLFYYLGALGAGSGLLALVANAVRRGRNDGIAGGVALFMVGCVMLLLAMVFDLEENRDLEVLLYDR
ncbi:glycosyltransferase family 2 protein (plasmid) [Halorarum halophilum]|uniref:Glycosyltransferase family 2 protein n=1 Tax=Halorarum halophilum TaxID=2743090 RepID=A0A7D5KAB7_9EURY|nr:glycosyltransferase family 2 protein [Halobaculum halophilum]QLG29739.1 glycosyltransferase family 2 protein [Halobaculum halophilum]